MRLQGRYQLQELKITECLLLCMFMHVYDTKLFLSLDKKAQLLTKTPPCHSTGHACGPGGRREAAP